MLSHYHTADAEAPISTELIDTIVRVAENTVDELTRSEGRQVQTGFTTRKKWRQYYYKLMFFPRKVNTVLNFDQIYIYEMFIIKNRLTE